MDLATKTQSRKGSQRLILAGVIIESIYLLYRLVPTGPAQAVIKYMAVYAGVFIILAFTWRRLKEQPFTRFHLILVLVFSFIFGLTLFTAPPDQSDDIYRYIWDGKLQYYHISPYKYAPEDPALSDYHSQTLPELVNFPEIKTIYPPLAQLLFRLSYTLFGESAVGMKFLFLLFMMGSIFLFYKIREQRQPGDKPIIDSPRSGAWLIIFFAWNPLVIMETAVNGHLDIMMVFFLLGFLFLFKQHLWAPAGILLACAVLTKLIPVILTPLIFIYFLREKIFTTKNTKDTKRRLIIMSRFYGAFVVTVVGSYALFLDSWQNMFLTAFNYGTKWYFNNPVFMVILSIFKHNPSAHFVSFMLFILIYLFILFGKMPIEKKFFWAFFAFIFMNPALHPWYLMVLLSLLCIYYSRWVMLWSGTVIFAYIVVYQYKLTGVWVDSWWVMALEYLPLLALSFLSLAAMKKSELESESEE
jgi:hypothetical protein